jgi:L-2,4-diaminobutyrate decarboxylase
MKEHYDPERFRELGKRVVDLLADALAAPGAVLPWRTPDENLARWPVRDDGGGDLVEILARAIAGSTRLHHPRYAGHQVTAPLPAAALCDLVSAFLNQGSAVYEMGPVANAMERQVVRWMASRLGLGDAADGVLTSGGSAGNLTALLAARQARAGWDAWSEPGPPLAFLVGESAHYSISRATRIMGWGAGGAVAVPADASGRMRAGELAAARAAAERRGRRVIGVAASACSTATGVYDPLEAIADHCAREGLWLHVDGAHGAAAALSERQRWRLRGIERADSVVWDGHKMLLVPALVTAVLFRDGRRSYEAFAQEASYLYDGGGGEANWWDLGLRTLECTKLMMALKLWAVLATVGERALGEYVAETYERTARFAERLAAAGDFEVIPPESNILCFRHVLPGMDEGALDARQARAREEIIRGGGFYFVKTRLGGKTWLRVTVINPLTRDEDLDALADAVRRA